MVKNIYFIMKRSSTLFVNIPKKFPLGNTYSLCFINWKHLIMSMERKRQTDRGREREIKKLACVSAGPGKCRVVSPEELILIAVLAPRHPGDRTLFFSQRISLFHSLRPLTDCMWPIHTADCNLLTSSLLI